MTSEHFQKGLSGFVRAFGLHHPIRTPCGQLMSVSEAHSLTLLSEQPQIAQHDLGAALQLDKSSVSRLVDGLVRRGWLERAANPDDGRSRCLSLTQAGEQAYGRLAEARARKFDAVLAHIPSSEYAAVLHALESLIRACDRANQEENDA